MALTFLMLVYESRLLLKLVRVRSDPSKFVDVRSQELKTASVKDAPSKELPSITEFLNS